MDVSEILKLLATVSIGLDDPDDGDIAVFMQFINLCYFEILQLTISQNPLVTVLQEKLDCTNGKLSSPTKAIFKPEHVYEIALNNPLDPTIFDNIVKADPGIIQTGSPNQWYYWNNSINVYPLTTSLVAQGGGYGLWYIPQPAPLTATSKTTDILIPALYQQILAFGAAYYVFQSETGFKDQTKMVNAQVQWEDGKKKLFAYLKNISGKKTFSTYSPV